MGGIWEREKDTGRKTKGGFPEREGVRKEFVVEKVGEKEKEVDIIKKKNPRKSEGIH